MAEMRLKGKLTMDDSQFQAVLRRSSANAAKFAATVGRTVATAGAIGFAATTAAALATSAALGAAVKQALDLAGRFSDLRAQTGASVKSLTILAQAFDDAGIGGENIGATINKLQKAIEEGNPALEKMGLNLADLKKQSPESQLMAVGRAIARIENPAQQSAAAMAIFGRSGGQLLAFFKDTGAIENARNILGSLPEILDRNADRFDALSDKLGNLPKKLPQFGAGLADGIPPEFDAMLDRIIGLDTAKVGQSLGKDITAGLRSKSIYQAIGDIGAGFISIMGLAVLSIGKILGAQLLAAFNGPAARFQARIEYAASTALRMAGADKSVDIQDLDRTIQIKQEMQNDIGYVPGGKRGNPNDLSRFGWELQDQIESLKMKRAEAIASGNVGESVEQIYARILENGGAKAGFGQGETTTETITTEIEKFRAELAKLIPATAATIADEINKPEFYGPPMPPEHFFRGTGSAAPPSVIAPSSDQPGSPSESGGSSMPAAERGRASKIRGARYGSPLPLFGEGGAWNALQRSTRISDQLKAGQGAHATLQSMPSAFERLQGAPSILSEPSTAPGGGPRVTVGQHERSKKILGAEATRRKKAAEAAGKNQEKGGDALDKIAGILESWDE